MCAKRRPKGEGSLYKRGRVYVARWVVDGKQYTRSTGKTNKAEAERMLRDFVAPFRVGDEVRTLEAISARIEGVKAEVRKFENEQPTLLLSDAWAAYLATPNRPDAGPDTLRMYESQFCRLLRWMESEHPDVLECRHVTREVASEFAAHLGAELSANSYNKYMTLFRRLWLVLDDEIQAGVNPWERIRKKSETPHSRRELTVEELTAVAGSVDGELRILFAVGIYTGLRLGDAVRLHWGAVDLIRGMISLVPSKTKRSGKPVVIPIHSALHGILSEIPKEFRRGFVMPELAQLYAHDNTSLSDRIQAVFRGCGIKTVSKNPGATRVSVDVGFHSLRHTFVSLSANAGAPLAVVQAIVGHSNPAMTRHYYHESNDALKGVISALPDVSGGNAPTPPPDAPHAKLQLILSKLDDLPVSDLEALLEEVRGRLGAE